MKKFIVLAIAAMIAMPSVTMAQKTTVQRVTREKTYKTQVHNMTVWYQGELSVGYATGGKMSETYDGRTDKYKTDFSRPFIETVHGVRITQYAYAGLGLGFHYAYGKQDPDYSESAKWNTLLMPIFVNLRGYYPVSDDFAPFVTVSLGGSAGLTSEWDFSEDGIDGKLNGGLYSKVGVGLSYKKLTFDFGLLHQGLTYKVSGYGEEEKVKLGINSFYVNVGIKF